MTNNDETLQALGAGLLRAATESMTEAVRRGCYLGAYANRLKVPEDLIAEVYNLIDREAVVANLRPRINKMVVDMLLTRLRQSVAEEVKAAMADPATRDRMRAAITREVI